MTFAVLSDPFLFWQTVFLLLQIEQPTTVTNSYFLRVFFLFPDYFSSFQSKSCCYSSLILCLSMLYLRMAPAVLGRGHLHFSRALLVPALAGIFSAGVLQQVSSSVQPFSFSSQGTFFAAHIKLPTALPCFAHSLIDQPSLGPPVPGLRLVL